MKVKSTPRFVLLITLIISAVLVLLTAFYFYFSSIQEFKQEGEYLELSLNGYLSTYKILLQAYADILGNGVVTAPGSDSLINPQYNSEFIGVASVGYGYVNGNSLVIPYYQRTRPAGEMIDESRLVSSAIMSEVTNRALVSQLRSLAHLMPSYLVYIQPVNENEFVFLVLYETELFKSIIGQTQSVYSLNIFEPQQQDPVFSYSNSATDISLRQPVHTEKRTISADGMSWNIEYHFYGDSQENNRLLALFGIVVLISILAAAVYQLSQRQYRAQRQAENLEQQKDEFVAIASHELKTPLTSIKALTQIVEQKMEGDHNPLYDGYFRKMTSQIKRMEKLINDLLDVSRIRSGKLSYEMLHFDLDSVVRSVCEEMNAISRSHRVTVNGTIKKTVFGDKDRITQVVTNLLTNAAKYSPQANLIIVTMKETAGEAIVSFQDFGIGITKENQRRIFERFFRVAITEHKYKGLGIGLFISAEIIRKHAGKIWVKSTRGKGSTFFFSLPFHTPKLQ